MRHCLWFLALASFSTLAQAQELRLIVLDVGEGQAVLLQHGNRGILIDTGHAGQAPRVLRALTKNGVQALDQLILTHLHPDHASGYFRLREAYPATPVLDTQLPLPPDVSPDMVRWVNEGLSADPLRRRLTAGDTLPWGDVRIEVLWPTTFVSTNLNHHSLVLHIHHGNRSALLMGDAGKVVEHKLLRRGKALAADILIVGHHGASDASSAAFLTAVQPAYSVISVNHGNLRGYPGSDTLRHLAMTSETVLRTDERGDICLRLPTTEAVTPCKQ
jgi:competence protein ComEC